MYFLKWYIIYVEMLCIPSNSSLNVLENEFFVLRNNSRVLFAEISSLAREAGLLQEFDDFCPWNLVCFSVYYLFFSRSEPEKTNKSDKFRFSCGFSGDATRLFDWVFFGMISARRAMACPGGKIRKRRWIDSAYTPCARLACACVFFKVDECMITWPAIWNL